MNWNRPSRWLLMLLVVGCNAKLQTEPEASGGAGAGGACDSLATCLGGDGADPVAAGAPAVGPATGQRGQKCIAGGAVTEADGNPGKTPITTLDRCNDGLACDATKHCTSIPNCPQSSGPCVVYGTPVVQDTNTGGSGGSAGGGPVAAGAGGTATGATGAEGGIVALAADDAHLYWLEYGTRDNLGNYQNDGALRAYDLATAKTTTLAGNLPGPNALGITAGHAYVGVDGGSLIGSAPHLQLLTLPLSGGAPTVVQESVAPTSFAAAGDQAFWSTNSAVYTVEPSGAAAPTQVRDSSAAGLQADAADLYFVGPNGGSDVILRQPQTGPNAAPTLVVPQTYAFTLSGDSLYGVETLGFAEGMTLDQVPKAGGNWTRERALGAGDPGSVKIIGDRYFVAAIPPYPVGGNTRGGDSSKGIMLTGLLSSSAPPLRLVETSTSVVWQATATSVFWTDGNAIFSRPVTGK
ncbi:MAG: hypothetical protein ABI548_15130 [Polyangiaceae bacterium]